MTHFNENLYYAITFLAIIVAVLFGIYSYYQSHQASATDQKQPESSLVQQKSKGTNHRTFQKQQETTAKQNTQEKH